MTTEWQCPHSILLHVTAEAPQYYDGAPGLRSGGCDLETGVGEVVSPGCRLASEQALCCATWLNARVLGAHAFDSGWVEGEAATSRKQVC